MGDFEERTNEMRMNHMRVMYISNRSRYDIGARNHLDALKELLGEDNILHVNIRADVPAEKKENYISFGKYKNAAERIYRWLQGNGMYMSNGIIHELYDFIVNEKIEIVFLEESILGKLVKHIKINCPNVKVVVFYHDIGADLFRQWRKRANWIGKIENTISLYQEKLTIRYADIHAALHKEDDMRMWQFYKRHSDILIPLSSREHENMNNFEVCAGAGEKKKILFVGSSYYPNILGMRWFYKEVLPYLEGDFEIEVVGRGLEVLREEFCDDRVQVIGTVDSLDSYYREADMFIAPIFDGGGMKVKSMEAVSYAKCFVGTTGSLAGFWDEMDDTVKNHIVFRSDDASEWVHILNTLIRKKVMKHNKELYEIFKCRFSYEKTKELIASCIWSE